MQSIHLRRHAMWTAVVVAMGAGLAGLAGCGGGGGDVSPAPLTAANIDLSSANRDTVAHASAAGILGLSPADTLPMAPASAGVGRQRALAVGGAHSSTWLGHILPLVLEPARAPARSVGSPRVRTLAAVIDEPCAVSGTVSISFDDVDLSGSPTAGDVLTIAYHGCMDTPFETLGGTVTTVYTQIGANSLSARMTLSQFSDVASRHAMTVNGAMLLDFSQPGGTVEVTRVTADGSVVASVSTHLPFSDTVTLLGGFVEELTYDASALPPPGSSQAGRAASTIKGALQSAAAGGIVDVSTLASAPITKYDAEAYPRAGTVQVRGRTGSLLVTVLSAASVQLALDANGDGLAESTETVGWDWLF